MVVGFVDIEKIDGNNIHIRHIELTNNQCRKGYGSAIIADLMSDFEIVTVTTGVGSATPFWAEMKRKYGDRILFDVVPDIFVLEQYHKSNQTIDLHIKRVLFFLVSAFLRLCKVRE